MVAAAAVIIVFYFACSFVLYLAARLVQEYTNSIVGNASLLLVRFSSPKLAFCKSSELTFL